MDRSDIFDRFNKAVADVQGRKQEAEGKGKTLDHPFLNDKERKKLLNEYGPGVLNKDTQQRIHNVVFHPSVTDVASAKARHQMIVDALDDSETK